MTKSECAKNGIIKDLKFISNNGTSIKIADNLDTTGKYPAFFECEHLSEYANFELTTKNIEDIISQLLFIVNQEKYTQAEGY